MYCFVIEPKEGPDPSLSHEMGPFLATLGGEDKNRC